jgi:hypothetical protein
MSTVEKHLAGDVTERSGSLRSPAAKLGAAAFAFAAVTVITYLIAHPRMFTGFSSYDDEGYMLTTLYSFLHNGSLYNDVFAQYGPFYYEAWGTLFSVIGIPVTHDGGRSVTMVVWILTSLMIGLATQMLVFASIGTLTNEPMHPGGIIVLLLAAIVAISCFVRAKASVGAMSLLGGAVAALILVKVNVGIFAFAALALACTVSYAPLLDRRWPRPLVEIGFVVLPFALMTSKLGEGWSRQYAAHVAIAALAVVIALRARETRRRPPEELLWLLGGLLAVGAASSLAILAAGTSPSGLVDGLIRQPLRQADAFSLPFEMSSRVFVFDAVALAAAVAYWYVARLSSREPGPVFAAATSVFSILVGVELALSPIGKTFPFDATGLSGYQLSLLSFAWVALIPLPGGSRQTAFARLLLPPLAVLQALHAFPVAGSQLLWSAFLLVPVGVICVASGIRGLAQTVSDEHERRALAAAGAVGAVALLSFVANATLREPLQDVRAAYDASVPLDLPGARDVRLSQPEVELYRRVTASIEANCSSFLTLPGMDSFYVWTEQEPPTGYNATSWPTLFDDAHQRRVIEDADSVRGLCLLENEPLVEFWGQGTAPAGPLVRYMRREFRPLLTVGDYRLLKRVPDREPPA